MAGRKRPEDDLHYIDPERLASWAKGGAVWDSEFHSGTIHNLARRVRELEAVITKYAIPSAVVAPCDSPRVKGGRIRCELPKGHAGPHFARIDHTTTWAQRKGA